MNTGGTDFSELGRTYRITPIQQPERSSSFQGAYLSRIPLSPPLILQLDCWDANGEITIPHDELPFLVCHLTLLKPNGEDAAMVIAPTQNSSTRRHTVAMLYGTLIASPVEMSDLTGATGMYFCFPDVSVRYDGRWKLRATLLRITGGQPLDTAETQEFDVVPNQEYTAPAVTDLTRHFDAQGVVKFGLPKSEW